MIKELFKKAGELHGHYCPGLAIGVRASVEALRILEPEKKSHNLYCIAENRACYLDGIQAVFGATLGGLCMNAGLGFVYLFKDVKHTKRNLAIFALMFVISVIVAYAFSAIFSFGTLNF